jgi:fructose-1,6-bisphosphatase I
VTTPPDWPPGGPAPLCDLVLCWMRACAELASALREDLPAPTLHLDKSHGDSSIPWDRGAQAIFNQHLLNHPALCALVTEESSAPLLCQPQGPYLMALDPLDGSENLALCGGVGSFFALFEMPPAALAQPLALPEPQALPQPHQLCAAGVAVLGVRLDFFIRLDGALQHWRWCPQRQQPLCVANAWQMPAEGRAWSANLGHFPRWPQALADGFLAQWPQIAQGKQRVSGALAVDLARVLLAGGCLLSPRLTGAGAKLRLLYELYPAAYVLEGAGGLALCDAGPILAQPLEAWHQTSEVMLGHPEALRLWLQPDAGLGS